MSFMSKLSEIICFHKFKAISVIPDGSSMIKTSMCEKCGLTKKENIAEGK